MDFVDVKIEDLFDAKSGNSKYSQKYIATHHGEYPIYSAKTTGDMNKGYISTYDYDIECVQITANGANAGTVIFRPKCKFSIGADTRIYLVKKEYESTTYLKYLYYALQNTLKEQGYSWTDKAGKNKVGKLTIPIPQKDGVFDIEAQQLLAGRYELIDEKKAQIQDEVDDIINRVPNIKIDGMKDIPIINIFDIDKAGGKSIYTKKYCKEHPGAVPVYAASSTDPLGYTNEADFTGEYLTWARNGLAGYITKITHPFCINADRGVLIPLDGLNDQLDLDYIKYVAEPRFRDEIKGRLGDKGKNEYTKLHPSMVKHITIPMPVKDDGTFDLAKQQEIAKKYARIDELKAELQDKVDEIMNTSVIID